MLSGAVDLAAEGAPVIAQASALDRPQGPAPDEREAALAAAPSIPLTEVLSSPEGVTPPVTTPVPGPAPTIGWLMPTLAGVALAAVVAFRWYRLPKRSERPRAAMTLLVLAALMILLQQIGVAVGATLAGSLSTSTEGIAASARTQAFGAIGLLVAQLPIVAALLLLAPRRDRRPLRESVLGIAALVVVWPIVTTSALMAIWFRHAVTGEATRAIGHETLRTIVDGDAGAWRFVLAGYAVLGAPLVEEVLYRGLLQPAFRSVGFGPWSAISGVSLLFAVAHVSVVDPPALVALVVLGAVFGWLRERTGGLMAPIVAHAAFNAANLLIAGL